MKINVDGHIIETSKISAITDIMNGSVLSFYIIIDQKKLCISTRGDFNEANEQRFQKRRKDIIEIWNEERKDIPKF